MLVPLTSLCNENALIMLWIPENTLIVVWKLPFPKHGHFAFIVSVFLHFRFVIFNSRVFNLYHWIILIVKTLQLDFIKCIIPKSRTFKQFLVFLPDAYLATKIPDMSGKNLTYGNTCLLGTTELFLKETKIRETTWFVYKFRKNLYPTWLIFKFRKNVCGRQ